MATSELQGLTDQELSERIREEKASINKVTLNHTISPVESPARIRASRRNIAKLMTELNRRKIAAENNK